MGITSAQTSMVLTGRLRVLRDAGFRVTLLTSPGELAESVARSEGVEIATVPMQRRIAPLADLISFVRIYRVLRRLKPDMVEFSTPKAGLLGMSASWLLNVPRRVYLLRGLRLERTHGVMRWVLLQAERICAACADAVVCNSVSLRCEAEDLGIGAPGKLKVLGSGSSRGVDTERFAPGASDVRFQYGIQPSIPVIGFVGRLTRDKGLPELLVAFHGILKVHPDAYLMLVGWFDESEDAIDAVMRKRIETHPRILCTGYVSDPAPYYRAMDVFVLPSWREGFPNAVLEAAATGVPAITTLSTGARDAVVPEVTGLLVPPGYPEAIREAVVRLLNSRQERKRMGAAARTWVQEHFADSYILNLTVAFYLGLLGIGQSSGPINGPQAAMDSVPASR